MATSTSPAGSIHARKGREVCFLIGRGNVILWSDASDSPSALPDSRARWEAIWRLRQELIEISHSHPHGPAAFSQEDESTFAALVAALGGTRRFSVVAPSAVVLREQSAGHKVSTYLTVAQYPWWVSLLRLASGMA